MPYSSGSTIEQQVVVVSEDNMVLFDDRSWTDNLVKQCPHETTSLGYYRNSAYTSAFVLNYEFYTVLYNVQVHAEMLMPNRELGIS